MWVCVGLGRWALGVGRWALGLGRWVLGVGRWVLGVGRVGRQGSGQRIDRNHRQNAELGRKDHLRVGQLRFQLLTERLVRLHPPRRFL